MMAIFSEFILFVFCLIGIVKIDGYPIDIVYTGDGCHCERDLPYNVERPVPIPRLPQVTKKYGYRVEVPETIRTTKLEYKLDFEVERPVPKVTIPTIPEKNLYARVDRIAFQMPDCPYRSPTSCHCGLKKKYPDTPYPFINEDDYDFYKKQPTYRFSVSYPRYLTDILQNHFVDVNDNVRMKRDTLEQKKPHEKKICKTLKKLLSIKTKQNTKEDKPKLSKRSIESNYAAFRDVLRDENVNNNNNNNNNNKSNKKKLNYEAPEALQYMPEVTSKDFQQGKCFACQQKRPQRQQQQTPKLNDKLPPIQVRPSVYEIGCQPILSTVHIACDLPKSIAQNMQSLPSSLQTSYTNGNFGEEKYVYDRLGHKYKQNNEGSLKLIKPTQLDNMQYNQENVIKMNSPVVGSSNHHNINPTQSGNMQYHQENVMKMESPMVGSSHHHNIPRDPEMENLIQDIVMNHNDFIEASDHGEGVLTPSVLSQRHDIYAFLRRLLGDRLAKWFHDRYTQVHENENIKEDNSLERVQRSLENEFDIIPLQKNEQGQYFLFKLIPKENIIVNEQEPQEVQKIQNNHIVKFRKDGKMLQLLNTSKTRDPPKTQ